MTLDRSRLVVIETAGENTCHGIIQYLHALKIQENQFQIKVSTCLVSYSSDYEILKSFP